MSHMKNIPKIKVAWNLWKEDVPTTRIAERLKVHRATVYRWITHFKKSGYFKTVRYYKGCKTHPRKKTKTDPITKRLVWMIREKHNHCCGEKIRYWMRKKYDIKISVKTIYIILNEKYKLRKRYKQRKYGEAPKGNYERDVIQADTVDFGEVYAFTYVDTYTRQAVVDLELGLEANDGYASLTVAKKRYRNVRLLQNDGGPEFKGIFTERVNELAKEHRVSRPYKKNEQAFIESFNRSLRKECLGWRKYARKELPKMKEKLEKYLKYYNNERPHLSLGMRTPNEIAKCRI